jgi:hypothetical protein
MNHIILTTLITVLLIFQVSSLKMPMNRNHELTFGANQKYCLQELNKVI